MTKPTVGPAAAPSLLVLLLLLSVAPPVLGHSPYTVEDNASLDDASFISDPAKSWAFYARLNKGGEAQYYSFAVNEGERIYASLFLPHESVERGFMPRMVLMGPGIPSLGNIPDYVQVPSGAGAMVLEANSTEAAYEPFTPSAIYDLVSVDISAPAAGSYYLVVFEPSQGGKYGLAVGTKESFTVSEWLLIPVSLLFVYQWEGQSPSTISAPVLATVAVGIMILLLTRMTMKAPGSLFGWLGALAGLFMIGSAASILYQMSVTLGRVPVNAGVALTLTLAALSALLGLGALRLGLKGGRISPANRVSMILIGIVALFAWSGIIIGSVLALASAFMPGAGRDEAGIRAAADSPARIALNREAPDPR